MDQPGEFDFYKDYMNDDEYILWNGKPDRGNLLEAKDGVFISLGTGFVLLTLFFLDLSMKYVHSVFLIVFLILCLAFELEFFWGKDISKGEKAEKNIICYYQSKNFHQESKEVLLFLGRKSSAHGGKAPQK